MDPYLIFLIFTLTIRSAVGQLRCYACSFSAVDTDQSCVVVSDATPSVECSMQYCVIVRQEFVDPAGTIASFLRGCDDSPDHLNHEVVDDSFRTFYRACTSDLCNTGNGVEAVVGGNLEPNPQPTGPNLLVPGTGAATRLYISLPVLLTTVFLLRA